MIEFGAESLGLVALHLFSFKGALLLLTGVAIGLLMGAIPGLGAMTAIVLVLPFTFGWDHLDAFLLLSALFGSTTVGGSVSAILINIPGTPENIATTIDGYQLTRQGRAVEALAISGFSSLIGSFIGILIFLVSLPFLKPFALAFGPPEVFWLGLFTLVLLSTATGGSFIVNMLIGSFAFVLSLHGLGPLAGVPRFTHGITYLWGGIPLIAALIGTFAIPEVIETLSKRTKKSVVERMFLKGSRVKGFMHLTKNKFLILRSSILGFVIGVIPGVGGTVANYLAYAQAVQTSKNPHAFGKGEVKGIIAPEAANNAKDVGQLIPTFSLGIPGSGTMTVFLGALLLHGIVPGPTMLKENMDVVLMVTLTLVFAFMFSCITVIIGGKYFSRILELDASVLSMGILTICFIAIYFVRYEIFDLVTMLLFGLFGLITIKLKGSRILLILPLIIGPIIEHNFILTLQISRGDYGYFFSPISSIIVLLTILSVLIPIYRGRKSEYSQRETI